MYLRLLLLALGWKPRHAYEKEAANAVRRYLLRLLTPLAVVVLMVLCVGYILVNTWHVSPTALAVALLIPILLLSLLHRWRAAVTPKDIPGAQYDPVLSGYVEHLAKKNALAPLSVYRFACDERYMSFIAAGEGRIVVSDGIIKSQEPLGMIGCVAHELAHRELPLGIWFADLNQTFLHCFFDVALMRMNRVVMVASQEFLEQRTTMSPHEVTRRMVVIARMHRVNQILWHLSAAPALQLREHAADAIAVCMMGHVFPLLQGLTALRTPPVRGYRYVACAHPETSVRIEVLRAMEKRLS